MRFGAHRVVTSILYPCKFSLLLSVVLNFMWCSAFCARMPSEMMWKYRMEWPNCSLRIMIAFRSQFWFTVTLFRVFQVESTQKWFSIPFFWGRPGIVQLSRGPTGWLFAQEAQRRFELPTFGSAARYLNHWVIEPANLTHNFSVFPCIFLSCC